jgi:hypothetical protein
VPTPWLAPFQFGRRSNDRQNGGHKDSLAKETAANSGKLLRTVERDITQGRKLGPDLDRIAGTSLDKGAELDPLAAMGAPARGPLIERAAACENVGDLKGQRGTNNIYRTLSVSLAGNHGVLMSQLLTSLLKLAVVPARFGLIMTEATLSVGKSVVGLEPLSTAETGGLSDQEIGAAASVIRASLLTGQPLDFHDKLRAKFPDTTIRSIAEASLLAARNARISAATGTGSRH